MGFIVVFVDSEVEVVFFIFDRGMFNMFCFFFVGFEIFEIGGWV